MSNGSLPSLAATGSATGTKKPLIEKKVVTGFVMALAILVGIALIQHWAMLKVTENNQLVTHTVVVLSELGAVYSSATDVEAGVMASNITGQKGLSHPEAVEGAWEHLRKLRQLTSDNPSQQGRLNILEPLITARFAALHRVEEMRNNPRTSAARDAILSDSGLRSTEQIHSIIQQMMEEERSLLARRTELAESSARRTIWVSLFGNFVALGLIVLAGLLLKRDLRARRRGKVELLQSEERFRLLIERVKDYAILTLDPTGHIASWNSGAERIKGYKAEEIIGQHFSRFYPKEDVDNGKPEMELRVASAEGRYEDEGWRIRKDGSRFWSNVIITALRDPEGQLVGFSKIARDLTERKRTEEGIQKLNKDLERRSAELEATNKELEAFTYSVSHDLRAPLRHIDGFSKLLMEEHIAEFSEEGREFLSLIRESTREMGQLVDDLLNLARVGRAELTPQITGLDAVVGGVVNDLKLETAGREIEWSIQKLPFVECDPGLIRQVFTNLLSNAVKYSRPRKPAKIEVGELQQDGERVIFVGDNGVGFNMKNAGKLFGVFQRLHRQEDFEGTGVGLATVQRIIRKHGGRVWAEAELDKGAKFYFTLKSSSNGVGKPPEGDMRS